MDNVNNIIEVAHNGEKTRGSNGAVLVDEDKSVVVYLLINEFPEDFQENLSDLLTEDESQHIFVVKKQNDVLDVLKLKRMDYM